MPEPLTLTPDERDARLVLDSVLTPRARGLVEQLGDARRRGLEAGHSAEELDRFLFKPNLSRTTRRFMAEVAEGLTASPDAPLTPPLGAQAPREPAGAMPGTMSGAGEVEAPEQGEEPGWGTALGTLAGLAGIAVLTRGRGLARAYRALPPETQARIMQMVAGTLGAGALGTMWWRRNEAERAWPRR